MFIAFSLSYSFISYQAILGHISGLGAIFYEISSILSTLVFGILVLPSLYQPLFSKNNE